MEQSSINNRHDRIVAFVDILGFKKLAMDAFASGPQGLQELYITLGLNAGFGQPEYKKMISDIDPEFQYSAFSDCVVVSNVCTPGGVNSVLQHMVLLLRGFLDKGYFCRGGIAAGGCVHQDNVLFGPAMLRAYELEQKVAVYPRIVVDDNIVNSLKGDPFCRLYRDFDGYWYVDPLNACRVSDRPGEMGPPFSIVPDLRSFEMVSNLIKNNLSSHAGQPGIVAKFRWLALKYNEAIREWPLENLAPINW